MTDTTDDGPEFDRPAPIEDGADVLDLRDVIARVEHLRELRQPGPVDLGPDDNECAQDDLFQELSELESLLDSLRGMGGDEEWEGAWYPVTLIRESYMEDYAREAADDMHGEAMRAAQWPFSHIDWEAATNAFRMDYASVQFMGYEYLYR